MANDNWGNNVVSSDGNAPTQAVRTYKVDFGACPASTFKSVAHGIPSLTLSKVCRLYGTSYAPSVPAVVGLPFPHDTAEFALTMDATDVTVTTDSDQSVYTGTYIYIDVLED